jgi:hypothetical protein
MEKGCFKSSHGAEDGLRGDEKVKIFCPYPSHQKEFLNN